MKNGDGGILFPLFNLNTLEEGTENAGKCFPAKVI